MNESQRSKVGQLRIDPAAKRRSQGTFRSIFIVTFALAAAAVLLWRPWETETSRIRDANGKTVKKDKSPPPSSSAGQDGATRGNPTPSRGDAAEQPAAKVQRPAPPADGIVLTVSGYIINRERIELSPRFMGQVRWIGVKKGDAVTNGQVVCLLDDTEYQAQKTELMGRHDSASIQVRRTELELQRIQQLADARIDSQRSLDLARLDVESARAEVKSLQGQLKRIETWIDWTIIRSPINGVVLEKLVDPNELVTPQSFGGTKGPSTALISVGDPKDLQVEIDINETYLAKVALGQKCRVIPDAYQDRVYDGVVAEVAPEASRQKGTLQVKVQIKNPDRYLTPELSAKVDFFADANAETRSGADRGKP